MKQNKALENFRKQYYYNKKYIARNYEVIYTFGTAYLGLTEQETYKYLFGIIDNRTDSVSVSSYNDIY